MSLAMKLGLLALGGASGTMARFAVASWANHFGRNQPLPLGTLLVNVLGCLAFGIIAAMLAGRVAIEAGQDLQSGTGAGSTSPEAMLLLVGFMGAFTTFSTFAFDTATLARENGLLHAGANLLLHNVVGLTMVMVGLWIGGRLNGGGAS